MTERELWACAQKLIYPDGVDAFDKAHARSMELEESGTAPALLRGA